LPGFTGPVPPPLLIRKQIVFVLCNKVSIKLFVIIVNIIFLFRTKKLEKQIEL